MWTPPPSPAQALLRGLLQACEGAFLIKSSSSAVVSTLLYQFEGETLSTGLAVLAGNNGLKLCRLRAKGALVL